MKEGLDKQRILIVDDTPANIHVLMETLQDDYVITVATNGEKALKMVNGDQRPDLILLDIMMPGMDGYEVCQRLKDCKETKDIPVIFVTVKDQEEDETRGLELGAVDYITKPISPPIVKARVRAHLNLENARQALQDLLNKTLGGSVRVLTDLLAIVNPVAFSRSSRLKRLVREMALKLGLGDLWKFELAAMLSQIGCVTVPPETLDRLYADQDVSEEERKLYEDHPAVGAELLAHIPRLGPVAGMIARQQEPMGKDWQMDELHQRDEVTIGSQLLRIAIDYDHLITLGTPPKVAIQQMLNSKETYVPLFLNTFLQILSRDGLELTEKAVEANALFGGMILDEDVYFDDSGFLVATKGTELSSPMVKFLHHLGQYKRIKKPIRVLIPTRKDGSSDGIEDG